MISEAKAKCLKERANSTKMLSLKGPEAARAEDRGLEGAVCEVRGRRRAGNLQEEGAGQAWRTGGEDR